MRELALVLALLGASLATTARAQDGRPDALAFDEAVRLALETGPARVEGARAAVAHAGRRGAGVYDNPSLAYDGWFTFDGSNEAWNGLQHQITLGIPIALSDPMSARAHAADEEAEAADARADAARAALAERAALAWLDVLALEAAIETDDALEARLTTLVRIVEGRAGAGDRSRLDVLRLRTELARAQARTRRDHAQAESAARALGALLGEPAWAPRSRGSLEASLAPATTSEGWDALGDRLPARRAAAHALRARHADLERERREAWPIPVLALGYAFTTDLYASAAYVGLASALPVFDQHEREIAMAEAEERAAEVELEVVDRLAHARLERARRDRETLARELDRFDAEVIAPAAPIVTLTEAAYRDGAAGVLDILDAARTWHELARDRLERLAALRAAEIELRAAAGQLP